MKKQLLFVLIVVSVFAYNCGGKGGAEAGEAKAVDSTATAGADAMVDVAASKVEWVGKKVGGQHNGSIGIKDGMFKMTGGKVTGGMFTFDMNALNVMDLQGEDKGKLEGHLKSPDFFEVEKFPDAKFEITSVKEQPGADGATHAVDGNLTLRGVTKSVMFPATIKYGEGGKAVMAMAKTSINRNDWGVKFHTDEDADFLKKAGAKAKDQMLNKEIELTLNIVSQ